MDRDGMQTTPEDAFSYIFPIGYSNSADCGYCRRSRSGFSYYATAGALNPEFYQSLIDRCWRRSGTLLYRPNQRNACCPHYTLRLDSAAFKPRRDQRQTINRFNRHVIGDAYAAEAARLFPRSREETKRRETSFDLVERVHEAESNILKSPPQPAHDFAVTLEPDTFTEEKYAVFENYQRVVHQEPPHKITRTGFKRFLCNSPLRRSEEITAEGKERQLGSFHQCYRLDGKLVAIGVLDLLPHCVSAVYFLYHESIHNFCPGKLGALREIALAIEGGYRWWYSGYYIHSCPKMRYKIDYSPQYILDPETLAWDVLDKEVLDLLDRKSYVSLSRERWHARLPPRDQAAERLSLLPDDVDTLMGNNDTQYDSRNADDDEGPAMLISNMPGIPSLQDMLAADLDNINIRIGNGTHPGIEFYVTGDLSAWNDETVFNWNSLKSKVAELVAAIGLDLLPEMCLEAPRGRNSTG